MDVQPKRVRKRRSDAQRARDAERQRQRRRNNPEKAAAEAKACWEKQKQRRAEDPDYREHQEQLKSDWQRSNDGVWSVYKRRAARIPGGREFTLTYDQLCMMLEDRCHYCLKPNARGVDRTDNDKGYVWGNCVPCCWPCNEAKGCMPYERFVQQQRV